MITKIILADDEERWRMIVRDFLENEGYLVYEAADGQEVLRLLRENPDTKLVILDYMMAGMDGIVTCRDIRTFSSVPVIIVTAAGD
jgi:DNA-binding response OmpR family regulator